MSELNTNLVTALGEFILKEAGVPFEKVVRVDFHNHSSRGWSEYTPADWHYPVNIRYVRNGEDLRYTKSYHGLHYIITILEKIDDAIWDSFYDS